jgi:hypothetical protein
MNKKLLLGVLSIAIVAVIGIPALMNNWSSCLITMHVGTDNGASSIGQFSDCLCTCPITSYNWGNLAQDQTYEMTVYVKNTGTVSVYLFYYVYPKGANAWIPTIPSGVYPGDNSTYFNNQEASFEFNVTDITHEGAVCELDTVYYPGYHILPCKYIRTGPENAPTGFTVATSSCVILDPGKVQKFDVKMTTGSLVNGATYDMDFVFAALQV